MARYNIKAGFVTWTPGFPTEIRDCDNAASAWEAYESLVNAGHTDMKIVTYSHIGATDGREIDAATLASDAGVANA